MPSITEIALSPEVSGALDKYLDERLNGDRNILIKVGYHDEAVISALPSMLPMQRAGVLAVYMASRRDRYDIDRVHGKYCGYHVSLKAEAAL